MIINSKTMFNVTKKKVCITKGNMISAHKITGYTYHKVKIMALMQMGDKKYYNIIPFKKHLEDIEETLIDYGFTEEKYFIALWLSECNIPLRKRAKLFGKEVVKLSLDFNRKYFKQKMKIDSRILHIAKRITNINYAINNNDVRAYSMYVNDFSEFSEKLYYRGKRHENFWEYLEFTCGEHSSISNLYNYI
jgi:hypothetical protein